MTTSDSPGIYRPFLTVLAGVLLCIGVIFLASVLERWVAAAWMAYKFSGFSSEGFVTLSTRTAWLYIPAAILLLMLSYASMLFCKKRQIGVAGSISKYAVVIFLAAIVLYALLGFSPLNQWRA